MSSVGASLGRLPTDAAGITDAEPSRDRKGAGCSGTCNSALVAPMCQSQPLQLYFCPSKPSPLINFAPPTSLPLRIKPPTSKVNLNRSGELREYAFLTADQPKIERGDFFEKQCEFSADAQTARNQRVSALDEKSMDRSVLLCGRAPILNLERFLHRQQSCVAIAAPLGLS